MINKKKEVIRYSIIPIFLTSVFSILISFVIFSAYFSTSSFPFSNDIPNPIEIENKLCIYTTGEFEGRKTQPHQGFLETVDCKHNVFYDIGRNLTRMILMGQVNNSVVNVISLCNSTNGTASVTNGTTCNSPLANNATGELYNVYTGCGLANVSGTFTDFGNTGNWTVSNTFTSSCDAQTTNVSRLVLQNGTIFAGATFTLVTLQTNDRLIANWSQGIT